jgi:hypothetical protein
MRVRIIISFHETTGRDGLYFTTEDFDNPAEDFINPEFQVYKDVMVEMPDINGFPFERGFISN